MADNITFEIEGLQDFVATVDRMVDGLSPDKVEQALDNGARLIAEEVRKNAPVGPTGNLKKGVRKKKLKRWGGPAPYIVALDRRKAPHAWLVTHGTSGVRQVNPPHQVTLNGRTVIVDNTGVMPPNRFFMDSVQAKQSTALDHIADKLGKNLEDAMR